MSGTMLIDGCWRPGEQRAEIRDPANVDEIVGEVHLATESDVADAYAAAAGAARAWRRAPATERAAVLHRAAAILVERADDVARGLVREEGKILSDAAGEVQRSAETLRYFAGEALQPIGDVLPGVKPGALTLARRLPVGPVLAVTPFNFPLLIPTWKIAAALAFGNTVVWKPSQLTPLTAVRLAEVFADSGLPGGVLNLVTGTAGDIGDALLDHPELRALTFTGSTPIGRGLERRLAGRGVRVQLEMGGKNVAIVLDDAPVAEAARAIVAGAMAATGQRCVSICRAVSSRRLAGELRDAIVAEVANIRVGHGLEAETTMGPLVSADAVASVLAAVESARAGGAAVVAGGVQPDDARLARGHFVAPTVLDAVDPASAIAQEEVFGPVLSLISVADDERAIEVANSTRYGLNAAVFTRDLERALTMVDSIEAGMVHVNAVTGIQPYIPFGGHKDSSSGPAEQGKAAAEFFTELQVVNIHPRCA